MKRRASLIVVAALAAIFIAARADAVKPQKQGGAEPPSVHEQAPAAQPSGKPITVAVYRVETNGFALGGSEVKEINRIALQACFDAGLRCSARDATAANVEKEQRYGKRGKISQADYLAEFTLVGSTGDSLKLGIPGGFNVGGGYGKSIGGVVVGGGLATDLSGLGIRLSKMTLTGQITSSDDGTLAYSKTLDKLGLKGSFIIGEGTTSNAGKLLDAFRKMFEDFKSRQR